MTVSVGDVVTVDGGVWRVLATGAREGGATYVHLASETLVVVQRNGRRPLQVCGWYRPGDPELRSTPVDAS